jgi:hypothetical protein
MMTPEHPDWPEFLELVSTALVPEFDSDDVRQWRWLRSGTFRLARGACAMLGLDEDEIEASVDWWREHDVYCDEEILLNEEVLEAAG